MMVHKRMTNLFKYDFAPTRAPPIGLPQLNLPGSFDFGNLAYQGEALLNWGMSNWFDLAVLGFAVYGAIVGIPRILGIGAKWTKSNWNLATNWLPKFK